MSVADKINKMLDSYMVTNEGKQKITASTGSGTSFAQKKQANFEEAARVLKECICNFAPPSLAAEMPKMLDGNVLIVNRSYDGSAYMDITFNKVALVRLSLDYEHRNDHVYDILGLFTQGYEINPTPDNHKRVFGKWHGSYTVNKMYREPNDFIWEAVKYFEATYAKEYGVENVFIENELYW